MKIIIYVFLVIQLKCIKLPIKEDVKIPVITAKIEEADKAILSSKVYDEERKMERDRLKALETNFEITNKHFYKAITNQMNEIKKLSNIANASIGLLNKVIDN